MENGNFDVDKFLMTAEMVRDWPKDNLKRRKKLSELGGQTIALYDRSLKHMVVGNIEANGNDNCTYSFRESNSGESYHLCYANLERLFIK